MKRFLFVAGAALTLAGCSKTPAPPADQASDRPFASDRISVVTRGSGPDIVLVPGLDSHRDVWDGVADSLEGRYRLHLVQVNGFAGLAPGANADGPGSAPAAEEIARYITETGLTRPAVGCRLSRPRAALEAPPRRGATRPAPPRPSPRR